MSGIFRDLLYAARIYRRSAAFAATTVILLAHGIAVNTTIFSVIDAVFLRMLPVDRPEQLVRFVQTIPGGPGSDQYRYPFYALLREHKEVFSGVLAIVDRNLALRDGPAAERVRVEFVNAEFFSILGVGPSLGRVIGPEDERDAAAVPVVLSHAFWKRRYQSDRGVIGRKIWIQGRDAVIVGVTPRGFNGLSVETSPDIRLLLKQVLTLTSDSEQKRLEDTYPNMMVRLQPGIDFQQAKAEFDRLWNLYLNSGLSPETKQWESRQKIELQSAARGVSRLRTQFSTALTFLMIAAILLLLIVCANVAGLLLARSAVRKQEIAVRIAVGASSATLIRQMLTESALLTLAGGGAGLFLAFAAMPAISRVLPPIRHLDATSLPLNLLIEPDLRIFGFSLLLCVLTTILFGIGPAFQAARGDFYPSLKAVRSTRRWTGRSAVVMAQVALCTFLLTAAGLLLATFDRLRHMDPGFDSSRVVTFSVDPEMKRYTKEKQQDLEMRLVARVETLPGVERVAIAGRGLMRGTGIKITVVLPGQALDHKTGLNASVNWITPSYFSVMGMRLTAGRNYSNHEPVVPTPAPAPVVVNQSFAHHFFPDLDPIGRKFGTKADRQIIGVVSDAKYRSLREPVPPTVYFLWNSGDSFLLHVRTRMHPEGIVAAVQDIMRGIDPELPFYEIKTLAEEVDASLWAERLVASLASVFAVLAALLAAIGIYGLLSYTVAQRTGEIGIRMALGAGPRNIVRLICSQAFGIVLVGVALGIAAALAAAQSIRYLLYDVAPHNIGALSAAALSVIVVSSIAAAIPAIRASRVEPAVALRHTMNC